MISIHAPLRERQIRWQYFFQQKRFQSTLPYGSDRTSGCRASQATISIHAPLRERHNDRRRAYLEVVISIHAPLRERPLRMNLPKESIRFQSTLPYGSDKVTACSIFRKTNFNPRSLTGATHLLCLNKLALLNFNPRSLTGATPIILFCSCTKQISIHAPLRERPRIALHSTPRKYFNPRSLTGATFIPILARTLYFHFNPRSLTGATIIGARQMMQ